MRLLQIFKYAMVSLLITVFCHAVLAQGNIYHKGERIDGWSVCDTTKVELMYNENDVFEAKMPNNRWVCLEVDFNELNILEYHSFEIKVEVDYPDSLNLSALSFKFKDVNSLRSINLSERAYHLNSDSLETDVIMPLDNYNISRFFPREAAVDPKRINSIMMFFRFDTLIPDDQIIDVLIEEIRFY